MKGYIFTTICGRIFVVINNDTEESFQKALDTMGAIHDSPIFSAAPYPAEPTDPVGAWEFFI